MSEVGKILKEKRQESGLSISEASLSTKISPKVLNAIENGQKENYPALPFLKGFVRSYALYLKMDGEKILAQFLKEIGDTTEIEEPPVRVENAVSNAVDVTDDEGSNTRFLVIGGVVLLIGLIVGIKSLIDKYQREADLTDKVEVTSPLPETKPADSNPETPAAVAGDTTKAEVAVASESPNPADTKVETKPDETKPSDVKTAEVKSAESKPTEIKSTETKPTEPKPAESSTTNAKAVEPNVVNSKPVALKAEEKAILAKPAEIKVGTSAKPEATPSVEASKTEVKQDLASTTNIPNQEVIVEALDGVTLTVMIGDTKKQIKLKAGELHVLRAKAKIAMDISDGGAVNLTHNGRNRGVPGSLGQAKKVSFP